MHIHTFHLQNIFHYLLTVALQWWQPNRTLCICLRGRSSYDLPQWRETRMTVKRFRLLKVGNYIFLSKVCAKKSSLKILTVAWKMAQTGFPGVLGSPRNFDQHDSSKTLLQLFYLIRIVGLCLGSHKCCISKSNFRFLSIVCTYFYLILLPCGMHQYISQVVCWHNRILFTASQCSYKVAVFSS